MASSEITLIVNLDEGTVSESAEIIGDEGEVTWTLEGADVSQIKLEFRPLAGPASNGRDLKGPFGGVRPDGLNSIKGRRIGDGRFKYVVLDVRNPDKAVELAWPEGRDGENVPPREPPLTSGSGTD